MAIVCLFVCWHTVTDLLLPLLTSWEGRSHSGRSRISSTIEPNSSWQLISVTGVVLAELLLVKRWFPVTEPSPSPFLPVGDQKQTKTSTDCVRFLAKRIGFTLKRGIFGTIISNNASLSKAIVRSFEVRCSTRS